MRGATKLDRTPMFPLLNQNDLTYKKTFNFTNCYFLHPMRMEEGEAQIQGWGKRQSG